MAHDRWRSEARRCAPWLFAFALFSCAREQRSVAPPDASADVVPDTSVVVDTMQPFDATPVTLEEKCKRHEDCVALEIYPDGDLRCCLACVPQRAANKTSADAFIAWCAHERAMRECPVYDCVAPQLDPRCVGGKCLLAPRAR